MIRALTSVDDSLGELGGFWNSCFIKRFQQMTERWKRVQDGPALTIRYLKRLQKIFLMTECFCCNAKYFFINCEIENTCSTMKNNHINSTSKVKCNVKGQSQPVLTNFGFVTIEAKHISKHSQCCTLNAELGERHAGGLACLYPSADCPQCCSYWY